MLNLKFWIKSVVYIVVLLFFVNDSDFEQKLWLTTLKANYVKNKKIFYNFKRQLIERFAKKLSENTDSSLTPALDRIFFLASLHFLEKHMVVFYEGGFFHGDQPIALIRESILELCSKMKIDSIALIDAIAPPDYVLNSALGDSTGLVYKNLYSSMIQCDSAFRRITYLDEFMRKTKFASLKSNLWDCKPG